MSVHNSQLEDDFLRQAEQALGTSVVPVGPTDELLARVKAAAVETADEPVLTIAKNPIRLPKRYHPGLYRRLALTVTAVILLIAVLFTSERLSPRNTALARAIERLGSAANISCRITISSEHAHETYRITVEESGRSRITYDDGRAMVVDPRSPYSLLLKPSERKAVRLPMVCSVDPQFSKIVRELAKNLPADHKHLGVREVSGHSADGYEITVSDHLTQIWLDRSNGDLLQIRYESQLGLNSSSLLMQEFIFDDNLSDDWFGLRTPDGYELVDQTKRDGWERVAASEARMQHLTRDELVAEVRKLAQTLIGDWTVRYRVTSQPFAASKSSGVPEKWNVRLLASGADYLYQRTNGDSRQPSNRPAQYDVQMAVRGDILQSKFGQSDVQSQNLPNREAATSVVWSLGLLPELHTSQYSTVRNGLMLPDLESTCTSESVELLPWFTRVNGRACYVMKRTVKTQIPVFRNQAEHSAWSKRQPPRKTVQLVVIDASAVPGNSFTQVTEWVAIDPVLDYLPVRWREDWELTMSRTRQSETPRREIICSEHRRIDGRHVPGRMTYNHFKTDLRNGDRTRSETTVILEHAELNQRFDPEKFTLD